MSVKKGIVFLLLFFTGLVKILANPLDSLHLSDPQLDSLGNAIKADFEQIETQLKRNAANNQDENPVFVFHSSVSFGQQAGETYLYWNKPMSHPVVKASYGLANAGEEAEINTMLADLYNQTKRKMVVYMTSIARYPEVRLYKDGALVENGPTGRNAPQSLGSSVNTATDIVKKILYSSDASNRDFTTVVVVRVAQFNCDVKKKNNGKSTWEFETDKDVAEKISLKHSIRVVPANYISTTCISAIKSGFSNELKSDLKTFVSNVTTQFKSVQCDPPVECTSPKAAAFKQAIINAKADEIFKAISDLLTPKGQVITGPRTIKPGDKGAAYDEYMKVLSLCLNNTERVSAIKTFLGLAWTSTPYEQVIVDIIRYAPRTVASVNSLFNELEKQNIVPDLVSSVQGDNYETLISTLLELHQLRKFTATSPVVYWGTFTQNGIPSYKEGAYINTILQPDGKITTIGSYKYEFKTTDVQVRPINEMLNPFQNVCLTFISTPSKLTSNTYQVGKIYNIPAIYLWYINKTTWNGILIASAIDAFELAMTPAAIAEIRLAKGLWKAYLVSMTVVNSAQFGLKSAAVRGQILGLDGGTEFLNSWDKLVLYSNLAYFSPFALQNAKKLLASYVKCKSGLKANLSANDFEAVENTITKAEAELKSVGIVEVVNGAGNLAEYVNIRKYLGNSRIKQYLNNDQLYAFEAIVRSSDTDVIKFMNQMDEFDFAEMVCGYRDLINTNKAQTFIDAVKSMDSFNGKYGWLTYWKITPSIKYGITTIDDLRLANNLLPTANATDIQLGSLQAFTAKGDFINIPMRYNKSYLGEYATKGFKNVTDCLNELRKVPTRNFSGKTVLSGKAFSKADFDSKFINGVGKQIEYTSFISTSKNQSVAEGFIELTAKWAGDGEKVAVIQRIVSKDGVYIDDLSDWGGNLGSIRHGNEKLSIQVQEEVLLTPSKLRQTANPIPVMENGQHKIIDGMKAYYIDFIQL